MGRSKQAAVTGELPKPDYDLAKRILHNDIEPSNREQRRSMQEAGQAYKHIKKTAHVHPWAVRQIASLLKNEDAERYVKLRDLHGMLTVYSLSLRPDLVDMAGGADMAAEISVVPTSDSTESLVH